MALLHFLGPLAASERRLVEGHMADEVESVVVAADLLGEFVEEDTARREFLDDGVLLLGVIPDGEEGIERGVGFPNGFARVILQGFGDELAIRIEILDALGGDADLDIVHEVSGGACRRWVHEGAARRVNDLLAGGLLVFRRLDGVVLAGFKNLNGVTIEVWIGEERRGALEIHDGEEELAVVLVDAGATTDDLLELGHGADAAIEDDEVAGLGIDARRHEAGGAGYDWIARLGVDEVVELRLAFVVVASDTHHIFAVGSGEVRVGIHERLTHPLGVVDIFAEDDGFCESVGGFQKLRDFGSHSGGAFFEDQIPVEIGGIVFTVFDDMAVFIELPIFRTPAVEVFVQADADNFVGCEEAIVDALPERVGVDRLAEVIDI